MPPLNRKNIIQQPFTNQSEGVHTMNITPVNIVKNQQKPAFQGKFIDGRFVAHGFEEYKNQTLNIHKQALSQLKIDLFRNFYFKVKGLILKPFTSPAIYAKYSQAINEPEKFFLIQKGFFERLSKAKDDLSLSKLRAERNKKVRDFSKEYYNFYKNIPQDKVQDSFFTKINEFKTSLKFASIKTIMARLEAYLLKNADTDEQVYAILKFTNDKLIEHVQKKIDTIKLKSSLTLTISDHLQTQLNAYNSCLNATKKDGQMIQSRFKGITPAKNLKIPYDIEKIIELAEKRL